MDETLEISLLKTFVAIDECGGFGRAADALHRSQPTVSQHVRLLERRLGHPLVEKDGRGAKFTADGERLLAEARHIIAVHDDALMRLRARSAGPPASDDSEPVGAPALDGDGTTQVADFLRFIAERIPQLMGEWEADGEG